MCRCPRIRDVRDVPLSTYNKHTGATPLAPTGSPLGSLLTLENRKSKNHRGEGRNTYEAAPGIKPNETKRIEL